MYFAFAEGHRGGMMKLAALPARMLSWVLEFMRIYPPA
jgi:hypothetical protein